MKTNGISISIDTPKYPANKLAVLLPGYLDSKDYNHLKMLAEDLCAIGYTAVRLNPTGTWESDGDIKEYSLTRYLKDVEDVINYAVKQNGKKFKEIALLGHSFGGRVAIFYGATHPEIKTVVNIMASLDSSKSPYTSALLPKWKETGLRLSKRDLPENPDQFREFVVPYSFERDKDGYNFLDAIKKYKNDLLVVAAEFDEVAPPETVRAVYEVANNPKEFKLIKGIGHGYRRNKDEVKIVNNTILEFFKGINKIVIVDDNDEVIGSKARRDVERKNIYRVSALWITNSKGDVLLAQRGLNKSHHPGKWGPAVAGTVEEGELYEDNIYKEADEELGIKNLKFKKGPHFKTSSTYNHFTQYFLLNIDQDEKDFEIQKEEVEAVKWFKRDELANLCKEKPDMFLESMANRLELFSNL